MSLGELRARWAAQLSERPPCIGCQRARPSYAGTRTRKATLLDEGFVPDIPVRRLRCPGCGLDWTHAPEQISLRVHYQPCVVSKALERMAAEPETTAAAIATDAGCHRRTLGRWIDRVAAVAEPPVLAAAIVAEADAPVLPAVPTEIHRPGGSHVHARFVRAITVLVLLEALASLRGLEPPALRHVDALLPARSVPADAPGPRSRGDPESCR